MTMCECFWAKYSLEKLQLRLKVSDELLSIAIFSTVVIAFKLVCKKIDSEVDIAKDDLTVSTVRLLEVENIYVDSPPITTLSFYEGDIPSNYIREKIAEIIRLNPWLQSRLLKINGKLSIRFPATPDLSKLPIVEVDLPVLNSSIGFLEETKLLKHFLVKPGKSCIGKDEDLFRVIIVRISEKQFAIVQSMSHVHADGHTFYEIHNMLSSNLPARAMIVERCHTFSEDLLKVSNNRHKTLPWLFSSGVFINVVASMLFGKRAQYHMYTVDQEYIDAQKKAYQPSSASDPAFISSNDVITSDFFRSSGCEVSMMAVNFRNHIPHITPDHAGNYEGLMAFQPEDYASPQLIRRAVQLCHRALSGDLPGFFGSVQARLSVITSWATFYHDVQLPECKLLCHRPHIEDVPTPFEQTGVLFKFNEKEMGIVTICKDSGVPSRLKLLKSLIV